MAALLWPRAAMHPSAPLTAFPEHYRALIAFVTRRVGSRQAAQDLVHDAWLRVAERTEPTDRPLAAESAPRAYLYTVAEHLVIDHLRRGQRTAERFVSQVAQPEGLARDVADACSHREALATVDAALATLPERCHAIFLADRLDGLPQAEIAARHGVSVKTVEREIQRALDTVEAALHHWRGDATAARLGGKRRRALSALLGLGILGAGATQAWLLWRARPWQQTLATTRGGQSTLPLPDGSTLVLDALTRLEVHYDGVSRRVRLLAGCAFFDVARDVSRPFVIDAAGARITVLGTRFEVAIDEGGDGGGLRVGVEQGRVRVERPGGGQGAFELTAGEALRWPASGVPYREATQGEVAGWREGWIDFRHEPLGEAVRRIARYSSQAMRVEPEAARLTVFGRMRIADADAWLRLLPRSLPVSVREEGRGARRVLVIARR